MKIDIDYSPFILWLYEELGLRCDYISRETGGDYIIGQNMLCDKDDKFSMQIYVEDGYAVSWNTLIDGKKGLYIKEIARQTGYLNEYISFICQEHDIPQHNINTYKDLLIKKNLGEHYDYSKFNKCRDVFRDTYISISDILGIGETKRVSKDKFKSKVKKKASSMEEVEQTKIEYNECLDYIENRKLEFIDEVVEPCTLKFKSGYRHSFIKFKYPDEFCKYRYCGGGAFRYVSKGRFDKLFEVQISDNKKIVYVVEGEFDSISFSKCIDDSIFAMHNVNSINNLNQLKEYDTICMLVDNDKYKEVSEGLIYQVKKEYPNKNVVCVPKFDSNDKSLDFNSYLCDNGEDELKRYLNKKLDKK